MNAELTAAYEAARNADRRNAVAYEAARDRYADALTAVCGAPAEDIAQFITDSGDVMKPDYYVEALGPPTDLRASIVARIEELGVSRKTVAAAVAYRADCNPESVLRYLRGSTDASSRIVSALFDELALGVTDL
jgi:hypothetical protein